MVWDEIDENIGELEKDFIGIIKDMESKDLISKETTSLQDENKRLIGEIQSLNKENESLTLELNKEIKLHDNLKKNYDTLQECIFKKETACVTFQNSMEIMDRDNLRLKRAKEQFEIGKDFTGIRWDYSAPQNLCKGYIVNKSKKSIDTFELNKDTEENVQEFLWSLVEKHSSVDWNDLVELCAGSEVVENKENKKVNY